MTIYIMLSKFYNTFNKKVNLYEIAKLYSTEDIEKTKNITFDLDKDDATLISLIDIVKRIEEQYSNADIQNMSDTSSVVCRVLKPVKKSSLIMKGIMAGIVLFFASGTAVINFYNDVGMHETFENIISIISGKNSIPPWLLTVAYCIGLAGGLFLFIGLPKKKSVANPDVISVEMNTFDTEMDEYIRSKKG